MVFGFDDILEGLTITDIAYWIGTALFGETTAAASVEGSSVVIQDLLGESGLEATIDLAKQETTTITSSFIKPEVKQIAFELWEDEGLTETQSFSQNGFTDRISTIAQNLTNKGVNIMSDEGKQLLKDIVNKAIELGKKGANKLLDPKHILSGGLGGLGVGGLIKTFEKTAQKDLNRREPRVFNTDEEIKNLPAIG